MLFLSVKIYVSIAVIRIIVLQRMTKSRKQMAKGAGIYCNFPVSDRGLHQLPFGLHHVTFLFKK